MEYNVFYWFLKSVFHAFTIFIQYILKISNLYLLLDAETSEIVKEESDIKQFSEKKSSSKQPELDLVAPMSSQGADSSARGNNSLVTPVKNQGSMLPSILSSSYNLQLGISIKRVNFIQAWCLWDNFVHGCQFAL